MSSEKPPPCSFPDRPDVELAAMSAANPSLTSIGCYSRSIAMFISIRNNFAVLSFAVVLTLGFGISPVNADDEKKPQPSRDEGGFQEVQLWKAVGYKNGKPIGESTPDSDKSKAEDEKRKMEKIEITKGLFYDKVEVVSAGTERRYVGKGTTGLKSPIVEENTGRKTVDPGNFRTGTGVSLADRNGTGTIGTANVTIKFTGNDNSGGMVIIDGDLKGNGDWKPEGSGVKITTKGGYTFIGVLRGDKLSGLRLASDGSGIATDWSLTLSAKPKENDSTKIAKGPDVAGTKWLWREGNTWERFSFLQNGKFRITANRFDDDHPSFSGLWESRDGFVFITGKYSSRSSELKFKAKIDGNKLSYWFLYDGGEKEESKVFVRE